MNTMYDIDSGNRTLFCARYSIVFSAKFGQPFQIEAKILKSAFEDVFRLNNTNGMIVDIGEKHIGIEISITPEITVLTAINLLRKGVVNRLIETNVIKSGDKVISSSFLCTTLGEAPEEGHVAEFIGMQKYAYYDRKGRLL